ncbi:MAG TPA: GMC family oxidoreductase [Chryseolinea sp.]
MEQYDAIVVGSGAAGGWAAKELTEGGLRVLLLEAGPPIDPASDYPLPASSGKRVWCRVRGLLIGQNVQMRSYGYNAKSSRFFVNDRQNPYITPANHAFNWFRGKQVGGRMHVWGRYALRFSEADFKCASIDGYGVDWPLGYRDLEPYYDKVESFHGLLGNMDGLEGLPDGKFVKPYLLNPSELRFKEAVETAYPDRRVISARILQHSTTRVPLPILAAQQTGYLTLRANAIVERVNTDPISGKGTGVSIIDRITGARSEYHSRVVMMCASTIETLRILLNSASERHPNGLGNSSGLLGRNFLDHVIAILHGPFEKVEESSCGDSGDPDPYDYGRNHGFNVPRYQNMKGQTEGFLRGYAVQGAIGRDKPHWHMMSLGELLPRIENYVSIDSKRRDRWGVPIPLINLTFGNNELSMIKHACRSMQNMADAGHLLRDSVPKGRFVEKVAFALWNKKLMLPDGAYVPGTSAHEAGGARMGSDPANSVVNLYNQCWDANNVYVTDGACFPSIGSQNITLTIMALTARACEHIVKSQ